MLKVYIMDSVKRIAPEFEKLMTQYNVNVPDLVEAIWQPRYDTLAYVAAGQTNMTFFQRPVGAAGVTEDLTNMETAGVIAAPQQFLVTGIRAEFLPAANIASIHAATPADLQDYVNDVQAVLNSGVIIFTVGNKEQNRDAPIGKFPPSHALSVDSALSDATTAGANLASGISYAQGVGQLYNITPTNIPFSQNFNVSIHWPTAVALPSGNDGTIRVHLEGFLYRSAQ